MKKIYAFLAAILFTVISFAQAPEKMSYQAVVRDNGDALVVNQAVAMQISILQGNTPVYVETQTPTTNANGLVTLEIGNGSIVSGTFEDIDWFEGTYFIKTETDPTGGSTYTITGTSQLLSVPYALHAKTAESISGGITETDPRVPIGTAPGQMQYWNSSAWVTVAGGTTGQLLSVNASGIPEWQNPSSLRSAATQVPTMTSAGVTLNGMVNANGLSTTMAFEFGSGTSYGTTVAASTSPLTTSTNTAIASAVITSLTVGTTYHVRLITQNIFGTFYGDDIEFTYLYVGATFAGGLVFSIDNNGKHGLVCAPSDQFNGCVWSDAFIKCSPVINGFDGWYLPGKNTLELMYLTVGVGSALGNIGGFTNDNYWSSSPHPGGGAWIQSFNSNGGQYTYSQSNTYDVRAVRFF
jgi:hypothetical protein